MVLMLFSKLLCEEVAFTHVSKQQQQMALFSLTMSFQKDLSNRKLFPDPICNIHMPKILAGPINILLLSEKIRNMSRRGHNVELKINFIQFEPNVLPEGHLLKIPFNLLFQIEPSSMKDTQVDSGPSLVLDNRQTDNN